MDQTLQEVKHGEDDIAGLVSDIMDSGGQALVFVSTHRSTEAPAKSLGSHIKGELGEKRQEHLKKVAASLSQPKKSRPRSGRVWPGASSMESLSIMRD